MAIQLMTTSTQAAYHIRVVKCTCAISTGKWPTVCMTFYRGVLDLCNQVVLEKTPQIV